VNDFRSLTLRRLAALDADSAEARAAVYANARAAQAAQFRATCPTLEERHLQRFALEETIRRIEVERVSSQQRAGVDGELFAVLKTVGAAILGFAFALAAFWLPKMI
jgi:hypothetical protein